MRVRIKKPAKSTTQSASGCTDLWVIEPILETPRLPEPLMGWTSAEDPLSTLAGRLRFETQGEAVTFARSRGWDYVVDQPNEHRVRPKNYVDNFNPDRRRDGRP